MTGITLFQECVLKQFDNCKKNIFPISWLGLGVKSFKEYEDEVVKSNMKIDTFFKPMTSEEKKRRSFTSPTKPDTHPAKLIKKSSGDIRSFINIEKK